LWLGRRARNELQQEVKTKKQKMKTIKTCLALLGIAALLAAPSLFASVSYNGTYSGTITLGNGYGSVINANASGLGVFETFCLNKGILANAGPYNYVSSDSVVPDTGLTPNSPNPIVLGTAWLYSQFRSGGLAGYTYGNAGSANDLQAAIWYFQGNAGYGINSFVTAAQAALNNLGLTAAGGEYGVFALTLTDNQRNYAQPVLGMVPEPSTVIAGALLLLPFGVSTLRILRKSKN
jgi:hypothetical protein